jgi:NTP pyrophosphatase (non-canonical NTP hydrolase)
MIEEIHIEQVLQGIDRVLPVIKRERERQISKWGVQEHDPYTWFPILAEEVGEVGKELAEAAIEKRPIDAQKYLEELSHTAAVAAAAMQCYDEGEA